MSTANSYCPRCGSMVEAECDFCTSCGEPKQQLSQSRPLPQPSHSWMQEPASPRTEQPPSPPPSSGNLAIPAPQYASPPPPPMVQHVIHQHIGAMPGQDSGLAKVGQTMGIIALSLMLVGLIPCLGWINWFNIPFGFITFILSIVGVATANLPTTRNKAVIGLVFGILAWLIGSVRLSIGIGFC